MSDQTIVNALERIATALERFATAVESMTQSKPLEPTQEMLEREEIQNELLREELENHKYQNALEKKRRAVELARLEREESELTRDGFVVSEDKLENLIPSQSN